MGWLCGPPLIARGFLLVDNVSFKGCRAGCCAQGWVKHAGLKAKVDSHAQCC